MFDRLTGPAWTGGDDASTVLLPDGRVLWLFSDTLRGAATPTGGFAPGWRLVRNSFVLQQRGCLTPVSGPAGGEVIPTRPDGAYYWPSVGLVDGGRLHVFAFTVRADRGTFHAVGTVDAQFALRGAGPALLSVTPLASEPDDAAGPQWGAGVVRVGSEVYVYGTRRVARPMTFGKALYVARVPAGYVGDQASWRYLAASGWSRDPSTAVPVLGAVGGPSAALSVLPRRDGGVMAVSKADEYLGREVVAWTAPTPAGPFTRVAPLAQSPTTPDVLTYLPFVHPELPLASGQTLLSVSRNSPRLSDALGDVRFYKPQFSAVILSRR